MEMSIGILICYGVVFVTFLILLFAFLGTHELMRILELPKYRQAVCLIFGFVLLVFQLINIADGVRLKNKIELANQYWVMGFLFCSLLIIIYLFASSLRQENRLEKLLEASIVLGIMQVAITMIMANLDIIVPLKLMVNMIYLALPAFVVYELSKPQDQK